MLEKFKVTLISSLLLLSISSLSALAAPVKLETGFKGTNDKPVTIIHKEKVKVSDSKILSILNNAKKAIAEEKSKAVLSKGISSKGTMYDYITADESQSYFYEESASSNPELIIYDTNTQNIASQSINSSGTFTTLATQTDFITDGVGGKQTVTKTGAAGSYLSSQMTLPTSTQVSSDLTKYTPYNYGGFEYNSPNPGGVGSWASDMGLQLYNNLSSSLNQWGWKPILVLKQLTSSGWTQYLTVFNPSYAEVQYHNGYKPGTSPIMYFWYNYGGKVRMKIDGTAICTDRNGGTLQDTNLITIMESNASWNICAISNWKLLSTVVSSDNTGKNKAVYSNIKVDGVAVSDTYFPTPQQDQANVTRSTNNVTITVDSSLY